MGIINVNIDSGLQSEPFYPSASILEISTRYNETPYFQKIKREPLVFNLTFAFENGFDDDKLRETARWLNQKTFKELYFSNQPDKKYFAIYEGSPRLFHTGTDGYFEITFRTNSPYAHSDLIETGIYNQVSPALAFSRPSPAIHPETGEEVPADTPIFMSFAEDKRGLLMEEGTTNFIPSNKLTFEGWNRYQGASATVTQNQPDPFGGIRATRVQTSGGTNQVKYFYSILGPSVDGQPYALSCWIKCLTGSVRIIGHLPDMSQPVIYANDGWVKIEIKGTGNGINYFQFVFSSLQIADSLDILAYLPMAEAKPYPTTFTVGTRAAPLKRITLPEALPATFGIGISTKMLHAHDTATRTFWQAGDYRCYFDAADNKIKITNGVVEAETAAVTWAADDIIGVYAGRKNRKLFVQAKIAGTVGDCAIAPCGEIESGTTLYLGSKADGSESINAVIGDFVLHDPHEIDADAFFTTVPDGGGE